MGKPKISKEAKKRIAEAGKANLIKWQAEKGHHLQSLKHGAFSSTICQRYSDKRTAEGQRLHQVVTAIEDALGGPPELTPFQQVRIGILRSRLIRFFQFSDWIDKKMDILDDAGNPIVCLAQLHQTEEGIAKILKELEDSLKGKKSQPLKPINEIIAEVKAQK